MKVKVGKEEKDIIAFTDEIIRRFKDDPKICESGCSLLCNVLSYSKRSYIHA